MLARKGGFDPVWVSGRENEVFRCCSLAGMNVDARTFNVKVTNIHQNAKQRPTLSENNVAGLCTPKMHKNNV
jgi:hypothetical protein